MKKSKILIAIGLVAVMLSSTAFAVAYSYSNVKLNRGVGTYVDQTRTKQASGGAGLACSTGNGASMYMQVRKTDGVKASMYRIFNGSGSDSSVPYLKDGYGHTLGRVGYSYKCRLAHRSQSNVSETTASGGWWP